MPIAPVQSPKWVRTLLSALSKMSDERWPERPTLSKENRALLEGDTEEQRKTDRDIIVRFEEAHDVRHDLDELAEKARLRLREVGRSE